MRLCSFLIITAWVAASPNRDSGTVSSKASKLPTGYNSIKKQKKGEKKKKKNEDVVLKLKDPLLELTHEIELLSKDAVEVKGPYLSKSSDKKSDSLDESDSSQVSDQRNDTTELTEKIDANDCTKEMCQYEISDDCLLEYKVNVPEDTTVDECIGCSLSIKITYDGVAWLGFAFSKNGEMIGSEAVIGHPLMTDTVPGKYYLGGKYDGAIQPMEGERQTLINATIDFENGTSILKFVKELKEEGEIEILPGVNTFLWARGNDNEFSTYHGKNRKSFQLNLLGERHAGGPDATVAITSSENHGAPDHSVHLVNSTHVIQSTLSSNSPTRMPIETLPSVEVTLALPCPPAYDPAHTKYKAGDKVEVDNYIWECRPYPYDMYCNIPDFKPSMKIQNTNAEDLWLNAWSSVGACYKSQSPTKKPTVNASNSPTEFILTALPTQSPIRISLDTNTGFPLPTPQLRFTEWNELEQSERKTAESIGYKRYSWNNLEVAEIEKTAFRDLSSLEQQSVMALGFDEQSWDCFMNHYFSYTWSELEGANIAQYFISLGWTQKIWERDGKLPDSDNKSWNELTKEEQNAATKICYNANAWDWVPLPSW